MDEKKVRTYEINGETVSIDVLHSLAKLTGFQENVPDIDDFIHDPYYLGKSLGDTLYPIWKEAAREVFPTPYHSPVGEIVLSGGIGLGKSTFALLVSMYDLCKLLCLKNPHQYYGLVESTVISIALVNATQKLAKGVLWSQFEDWVANSPFFKSKVLVTKGKQKGKTYFINNIDISVGSRGENFLGQATIGAIFSEINDMTVVGGQAEDNLDTIAVRRASRFATSNREIFGHIVLDSSSKGNRSFLDARIEEKRKKGVKDFTIFSYTHWQAKWHTGAYSGKMFKVYAGDEYVDPFIVDETNEYRLATVKSPERIIDVPVEHWEAFHFNILKALRDLAGVSTFSTFSFISSAQTINEVFNQPNPVQQEMIELDFFNKDQTLDKFIDVKKLAYINSSPRFIHIDLGIKSDSTGMSCSYFKGFDTREMYDPITGKKSIDQVPLFVTEWCMEIRAVPGHEVPIYKIQDFIVTARDLGYPIAMITTDGYQSTNLRQNLMLKGFTTDLVSVDRTKDPYNNLRNIILEGRLQAPNLEKLKREVRDLEENDKKFDHACFFGDTRVMLVDKETREIEYKRFDQLTSDDCVKYYTVSNYLNKTVLTDFSNPRKTKEITEYVEIELESGETVKCTLDHLILTTTGYVQAQDLTEEHDIITIY